MELGKRESDIKNMLTQIAIIRNSLHNNFEHIKLVSSQNHFLEDVLSEYNDYFEQMKDQKHKKTQALEILSDYIDGISKEFNDSETLLNEVKKDQKNILKEMSKIKKEKVL